MYHNVFNRFFAGTLSRDVYTDWVVVFVLNVFLNYKEKNNVNEYLERL